MSNTTCGALSGVQAPMREGDVTMVLGPGWSTRNHSHFFARRYKRARHCGPKTPLMR